jgi:hypothetical protein
MIYSVLVERFDKNCYNIPPGNGYSVLLAVCSAICPASFWSRSANLYWAEHFGE